MMTTTRKLQQLSLVFLLASPLALSGQAVASDSYGDNPAAKAFIDEMVQKHGFAAVQLEALFQDAEKKQKIIDAISRPAEKTLTWKDYRRIFMTQSRIEAGARFYRQFEAALNKAEAEFGVPAEVITAIIGVETFYGKYKGSYRVLDALATLAFDYPPRSRFFRSELEQYLLLTREQSLEPQSLLGSYAGAMGYGQFISSSYRNFAVDFDGDKQADLIGNETDAIGSVANYLARHGWEAGTAVAIPADPGKGAPATVSSLKLTETVAEITGRGVKLSGAHAPETPARLVRLEGEQGAEYWAVFNNFYSITRYNHSDLYAMAVYQLSQAIRAQLDQSGSIQAAEETAQAPEAES